MTKEELDLKKVAELRKLAVERNIEIPPEIKLKPDIVDFLFGTLAKQSIEESPDEEELVEEGAEAITDNEDSSGEPEPVVKELPAASTEESELEPEKDAIEICRRTAFGTEVWDSETKSTRLIPYD